MKIIYYLDNKKYAARRSDFIPRTGEEIRFNGRIYEIKKVVWIEDESVSYVAIDIARIN